MTRIIIQTDEEVIGENLRGAKVIHKHPDDKDFYGDCFSVDDFSLFCKYNLKRLEVISGLGRYSLEYDGEPITEDEAKNLYYKAGDEVLNSAFNKRKPIKYKQLDIMKYLGATVKGLQLKRRENDI